MEDIIKKIEKEIAAGKLETAIKTLDGNKDALYLTGNERKAVLEFLDRLSEFKKDVMGGVLSSSEETTKRNRITSNVLDFIGDIPTNKEELLKLANASAKLGKAIEKAEFISNKMNSDNSTGFTMLLGRFNRNEQEKVRGIINSNDYTLEVNKIANSFNILMEGFEFPGVEKAKENKGGGNKPGTLSSMIGTPKLPSLEKDIKLNLKKVDDYDLTFKDRMRYLSKLSDNLDKLAIDKDKDKSEYYKVFSANLNNILDFYDSEKKGVIGHTMASLKEVNLSLAIEVNGAISDAVDVIKVRMENLQRGITGSLEVN
jgi:hypothetical protein